MFLERITLIDHTSELVRAWGDAFADFDFVTCLEDDFFAVPADAMVSPANSFGVMDGGLDLAIRSQLGFSVQEEVQRAIVERHHGEIPIGTADIVRTGDERWPLLVIAPTMRIPESVAQTTNAYLAFRAALLAVRRHNEHAANPIRSIVCPGLGTGIGGLSPHRCAVQMRMALKQVHEPARIPSFAQIHAVHRALRTG